MLSRICDSQWRGACHSSALQNVPGGCSHLQQPKREADREDRGGIFNSGIRNLFTKICLPHNSWGTQRSALLRGRGAGGALEQLSGCVCPNWLGPRLLAGSVSSSVKCMHVLCNGHWIKSLGFSQLSDFMTKEGSKIFFSTDLKQNFNQ